MLSEEAEWSSCEWSNHDNESSLGSSCSLSGDETQEFSFSVPDTDASESPDLSMSWTPP